MAKLTEIEDSWKKIMKSMNNRGADVGEMMRNNPDKLLEMFKDGDTPAVRLLVRS